MKKLIALLLFTSCGYAPMDNTFDKGITITKMEQVDKVSCLYYGRGNNFLVTSITSVDFMFCDTCGKFQIGDTINFVKK